MIISNGKIGSNPSKKEWEDKVMSQEDKELLLKDLSARLPYHVCVKVWLKDGTTEEGVLDLEHNYGDVLRDAFYYNEIIDIKPYLRHMSSMTDEEIEIYHKMQSDIWKPCGTMYYDNIESIDWLNAHHFDYRDLIPKGLAIAVTKENNPYKE